jgi:hypothetical protein
VNVTRGGITCPELKEFQLLYPDTFQLDQQCALIGFTRRCKEPGVCTLLALRDISHGHTVRHNDDDYDDDGVTTPLSELDGWKDLTVDTDVGTMVGKLEGITIDGSGTLDDGSSDLYYYNTLSVGWVKQTFNRCEDNDNWKGHQNTTGECTAHCAEGKFQYATYMTRGDKNCACQNSCEEQKWQVTEINLNDMALSGEFRSS